MAAAVALAADVAGAVAADVAAAVTADVAVAVTADVAGASVAAAMMAAAVAAAVLAAAVTHAATFAAAVNLTQPPYGMATKHSAAAFGLMRALMPCQHQQHSHWVMWSSSETMGSAIGAALGPVLSLAVVLPPVHQRFWPCVQHSPCLQGMTALSASCCNTYQKLVRRLYSCSAPTHRPV